jgi:hypothetical protein
MKKFAFLALALLCGASASMATDATMAEMVTTATSTMKSDAVAVIAVVIPIAIGIAVLFKLWGIGKKGINKV